MKKEEAMTIMLLYSAISFVATLTFLFIATGITNILLSNILVGLLEIIVPLVLGSIICYIMYVKSKKMIGCI